MIHVDYQPMCHRIQDRAGMIRAMQSARFFFVSEVVASLRVQ